MLVLRGADGSFTSGNDLGDFMKHPPESIDNPIFDFLKGLASFPKPVIASVGGPAIGIGTTLLLHCDLVYAGESAKFALPFVNLGLVPEAASSVILPEALGHRRAAELLMLGDAFDASTASRLGLVNAVIPDDALEPHTRRVASALAAKPPGALRETKRLMKAPTAEGIREAMIREGELFLARLRAPEAAEAFAAFFEKRAPDFSKFD